MKILGEIDAPSHYHFLLHLAWKWTLVAAVGNRRLTASTVDAAHLYHTFFFIFFIYNLNHQSEFTFYKLMLWLLQCLDGESSSGESPVPQIRSIGQFLLSRLFSFPNSSVLRSGFSWVPSLVWCLLHFWWMTSCTYDMPRSACSVALLSYLYTAIVKPLR
jgi:hypothetical protein